MEIGDARVLHAAHPNNSDERRTVITLWYLPMYDQCTDEFKEGAAKLHFHQVGELYSKWTVEEQYAIKQFVPNPLGMHGATAYSADRQYDHNLDFMVRTPG